MNLVDNTAFTRPLVKALRSHVDAFAESMTGPKPAYGALERVRPCAAAWVYYSVLVAWAEDHGLVDPWLRKAAADLRDAHDQAGGAARDWLGVAYTSLAVHPTTRCLLDPRYSALRDHEPGENACRDLIDWWTTDAPSLAYDASRGPASITGWIPGDVLQHLRDSRAKGEGGGNAQTPWPIADGILDLTLVPTCAEFHGEPVIRSVDPACGTGHFLIRVIDYLWEWYTTGSLHPRQMQPGGKPTSRVRPATGGPRLEPAEAIQRIVAGVDGCEVDPLTAAVARLRVVVTIGDLMHRSGLIPTMRLDAIPPLRPRIVVGDSLLAGRVSAAEYAKLHPGLTAIINLGIPDELPNPVPPTPVQSSLLDLDGAV